MDIIKQVRNHRRKIFKIRSAGNVLAAGAGNKWQFENPPQHQGDVIMAHKCQLHRLLINFNISVKKKYHIVVVCKSNKPWPFLFTHICHNHYHGRTRQYFII